MSAYWPALAGGMLIGVSAITLLLLNGRVAGISGILGRLAGGAQPVTNAAFLLGLLAGPLVYFAAVGHWPEVTVEATLPLIVLSGFLVGFGTRMGSGCTSGHGVLGLGRLSRRSMVAVATFLATGIAIVTLMKALGA